MNEEEALSPYELARLERIKRNNEYLDGLGLLNKRSWAATAKDSVKKTNKNKNRAKAYHNHAKAGEERRSKRLSSSGGGGSAKGDKGNDDDLVMLQYTGDDRLEVAVSQSDRNVVGTTVTAFIPTSKEASASSSSRPTPAFRQVSRVISLEDQDFRLTNDEKTALSQTTMDERVLIKFEQFLVYHNKVSDQNRRNVMRQVRKLASGEGINYDSPTYGWKPDQYFMKGKRINLLSDFVDLMRQGQECENAFGRDHGNGWLLSHPLKKLLLFQQFCLQNPDFLATDSPLVEYYANDETSEGDDNGGDAQDREGDDDANKITDGESESSTSKNSNNKTDSDSTSPPTVRKSTPIIRGRPSKKAKILDLKYDPKAVVGKRIAKKFHDGETYLGTVSSYTPKSFWWKIEYDDGDQEDMDVDELYSALELYMKKK
mmetsp:Transcript_47053/g.114821  ORF Transcript_47053/g.114821 Transcript_47053/m.114821 type:complete len:429 (+) Transcript_47053:1334-2620(+)